MALRILCLGIGTQYSSKYTYEDISETSLPTIFDYELVIMDLNQLRQTYYKHIAQKKNEFKKFLQTNGVCYVILEKHNTYEASSNFDWCPFAEKLEIENQNGETVICESKDAEFIFDSIKFSWKCFFSKYPENTTILATNRANDPISIMVPYGNGYCIFLPFTDKTTELLSLLTGKGLNIIPEAEEEAIVTEPPSWATDFMTQTELKLLKTRNEINQKLGKYNKYRPLFWETGDYLQELVIDAFEEMGIEVTKLPKESHGDFEFTIEESLIGVCEVKGLSGNADRRNLRQLLDYFIEQRDIEKKNVTGVFIVNHFRKEKPAEREKPVTEDALDLIKKYKFHILTTIQLYDWLTKFWENKLTKAEFLRKFERQRS